MASILRRARWRRAVLLHGFSLSMSLLVVLSLILALPSLVLAVSITEYPLPNGSSGPLFITVGPDGNLWFTEQFGNRIGKITPGGTLTEFTLPTAGSGAYGITTGPDGNLWFTGNGICNCIGKITPAGVVTEFALPNPVAGVAVITTGPDGNLWFTEVNMNCIGKITPGGVITEYPLPNPNSGPYQIITGPDGNLWFAENNGNRIGRITPGGTLTEFTLPNPGSLPEGITAGPDGNLWFTETGGNRIGKITIGGVITEFNVPTRNTYPYGITVGPDGNLWFTENNSGRVGKITLAGIITEFLLTNTFSFPVGIVTGPDNNLWFTEQLGNRIGVLVTDKPPTISQAFGTASIALNTNTSLTFTISNPNPTVTLTGIAFSNILPPGLVIADPNGLTETCGGTVTAIAGSSSISLTGGTLTGAASCTIVLSVNGTISGTKTSTTGPISATESGPGKTSNTATLIVIPPTPTPATPAPPSSKEVRPADIIAQLRLNPDRFASIDPSTELSYTLSIQNIGPSGASNVALRFPIDPNLVIGYALFNDNRVWVSAIVTDTASPYVQINLPNLAQGSPAINLTLVFRPGANSITSTTIFSRYTVLWDDDSGSERQQLSNAERTTLTNDISRNDSGGTIELFNPVTQTITPEGKLIIAGDFYIPNELVSLWYTDKDGNSISLGQQSADKDGKFSFDFVAGSNLKSGESYSIVGYGNRSQVSGSCVITVSAG